MIKAAILGASRALFNAGVIVGGFALLLLYVSYRLLRRVTAGTPAQPRREAGFAAMLALAGLLKALQVELPVSRGNDLEVDDGEADD